MASSPSYGERPALQSYRRSFTVPHRALSHHEKAGLDDADAAADILYSHPTARIYSFAPPRESIISSSNVTLPDTDYPVDTVETLPWRSRTETLAAAGLMIIEKIRGSTNFLKSQGIMHAILRNSQCWCVDGESKFVMRVRKLQYYRIELPSTTAEDKAKVEELKEVLAKIMRFERTPCPFKRAFHVELPDDAITPRRKGQWKPTEPTEPKSPGSDPLPLRRTKNVRSWSMQSPSPLITRNGGASDYGFLADGTDSPRQLYQSSEGRSVTPSSRASSEDLPGQYEQYDEDRPQSGESGIPAAVNNTVQEEEPKVQIYKDMELVKPADLHILPPDESRRFEEQQDTVDLLNASRLEPEQEIGAPDEVDNDHETNDLIASTEQSAIPTNDAIPEEPSHAEAESDDIKIFPELVANENVGTDTKAALAPTEESGTVPDSAMVESANPAPIEETSTDLDQAVLPVHDIVVIETQQDDSIPRDSSTVAIAGQYVEDPPADVTTPTRSHVMTNDSILDTQDRIDGSEEQPVLEASETSIQESTIEKPNELEPSVEIEEAAEVLKDDSISRVSSADSFHTLDEGEEVPLSTLVKDHHHKRGLSEVTVTASTVDDNTLDRFTTTEDKPATPTLARSSASDSSWPEVETPLTHDNLRRRLKFQRSMSPMPPANNIFTQSRNTNQGNHLTSEFLQKACHTALVKPIEMVVMLVHILIRIAGGATVNDLMSGDLFKKPDQHRRNASFPDHVASPTVNRAMVLSDDEDDFGIPFVGKRRSSSQDSAVLKGKGKLVAAAPQLAPVKDNDADSMFDDLD